MSSECLKAFKIRWDKTMLEFVIAGDRAIGRYASKANDIPG